MKKYLRSLVCVGCASKYSFKEIVYSCPKCGDTLDVTYDYDSIAESIDRKVLAERAPNLAKYLELLPILEPRKMVSLGEGSTPLLKSRRLAATLGLKNLYLKDETRNPTGVFKDRATAIVATKALEFEREIAAIASTGNAAASMAGYAAKAGLKCIVMLPDSTPIGKLSQSIAYGARIVQVKGNYDQVFDLVTQACEKFGWYNCNPAINPYRTEGKKTMAYEICEQLNWKAPDWVIVPIGNGCNLVGHWKGFKEFQEFGFVRGRPRMVGIQAEGSPPVVTAFNEKAERVEPVVPHTLAGAIAVGKPRNATKTLKALKESKGVAEAVSDESLLEAQRMLASCEGIFGEPAAVAPLAGLRKLLEKGVIDRTDTVVLVITGNGLKDPETSLKIGVKPPLVAPDLEELAPLQSKLAA